MRTTVRLDEGLLRGQCKEARKRGETLTSLMERGLRLAISGSTGALGLRVRFATSRATGGVRRGHLDDTSAVLDRLDDIDDPADSTSSSTPSGGTRPGMRSIAQAERS